MIIRNLRLTNRIIMRYYEAMIHTDYAIARIRAYLKENGMAKFRLAVLAKVPEGCTREVNKKTWNPTAKVLRKIEGVIPDDFTPPIEILGEKKKKEFHS